MKPIRYGVLILAICFALLLSALNTAPALADESTPTAEPTSSEEVVVETEATPNPEDEATPPDVSEVDTVIDEESTTVAEVIESLPEDTTLVVVDENGEALPLASAEAAEILEVADPQWCPVGVTPGSASCSGIKQSFNGGDANLNLLAWLLANQAAIGKAGVIWIDEDYDSTTALEGGEIVLDGDDFTSMDNFALTINGGWVGSGTTLNVNNPSVFYVPFRIIDWTGAVTINNIVIDSATGSQEALEVITQGNITLNNVDIQNNTTTEGGAQLTNSSGTGNVVINDSTFNGNTGSTALLVDSHGTVTLKNVTVNGNSGQGAYINNEGGASAKAVTLNGTNHFNYNAGTGLYIYTDGAITINNITAMGNTGGSGAYLDNCEFDGIEDCGNLTVSAVTIKGTNNFSDNGWDGLRVYSSGVITISNVTANGNGTDPNRDEARDPLYAIDLTYDNAYGKGVYLNNYGSFAQKNITFSGVNTFNGNASNGLTAIVSGLLTVSNITANENECDPAFENGNYCAGAYLEAYMGITQTGFGRFVENASSGLIALGYYKGAVTLNNLFADGNGFQGVLVVGDRLGGSAPINVTINGTNNFTINGDIGLNINTDGAVTLNNITANFNTGTGTDVFNDYGFKKAVTLKGINTFNGNLNDGLVVLSGGAITTNAVTAISNIGFGASLFNCGCVSPMNVTMTGNNFFEGNDNSGLEVDTLGAITISNLTSIYNNGDGAFLNNSLGTVGGITIKGYANTSYNTGSGIVAYSNGAVSFINVTADFNATGNGVEIANDTANPLKPVNVTITGTNTFNGNGTDGLNILTYGTVTLTNITANENATGFGATIDNGQGSLVRTVTLNGNNTFNSNNADGLQIYSLGAIKVNNVMSNYNTDGGIELDNQNGIVSAITITGFGIFNDNGGDGAYLHSNGAITIANITANNNTGNGVEINNFNNTTASTFSNVTLTGVNTFNGNGLDGISITSDGIVTTNNITANDNEAYGTFINNVGNAKNIVMNGVNMFNNNDGTAGLSFTSGGAVTLTRIIANNNNDNSTGGATSDGVIGVAGTTITFTCGSLYDNEGEGYNLTATNIILKGVYAFGNPAGNNTTGTVITTRACPLP